MSSSNSLEIYYSIDPAQAALREPLFFHHTPKTAGTSFRYALRHFLAEHRSASLIVPGVRASLKAANRWPRGLFGLYKMIAGKMRIEAVMSHYTALFADKVDDPIIAMLRRPDEHYPSFLAFHIEHVQAIARATGAVEAILNHPKYTNPQIRSFWPTRVAIPTRQPESDAEMQQWLDLVDRTIERFTLFRMADYPALLQHCRQRYGVHLIEVQEKRGARPPELALLGEQLAPHLGDRDPLWLDRILYDRFEATLGNTPAEPAAAVMPAVAAAAPATV